MFDDEVNDQAGFKPHAKRLGRELAMQYLFRCDMRDELPSAATFGQFFEEVREQHALQLYNNVAVHKEEIDATIQARSENWEWDRLSVVDRNIMRIAVAEML